MSVAQRQVGGILRRHDLEEISKIGAGAFGSAILVMTQTGVKRVCKMIDVSRASRKEAEDAVKEAKLLSSLKHPYIVRYRQSFADEGWLCILMDFCEGGELAHRIEAARKQHQLLPEERILRWFTQAMLALKHLHDRHILHRDLKPSNFFLTKDEVLRMGDFGVAKVLSNTAAYARTQIGTPYYLSPEVCQDLPYACPSDVWAMGCILYEMCALRVPFEAKSIAQLVERICRGTMPVVPAPFSDDVRHLVRDLLVRDPDGRPAVDYVLRRTEIQVVIRAMLAERRRDSAVNQEAEQQPQPQQPVMQMPSEPASRAGSKESVVHSRSASKEAVDDRAAPRDLPSLRGSAEASRRGASWMPPDGRAKEASVGSAPALDQPAAVVPAAPTPPAPLRPSAFGCVVDEASHSATSATRRMNSSPDRLHPSTPRAGDTVPMPSLLAQQTDSGSGGAVAAVAPPPAAAPLFPRRMTFQQPAAASRRRAHTPSEGSRAAFVAQSVLRSGSSDRMVGSSSSSSSRSAAYADAGYASNGTGAGHVHQPLLAPLPHVLQQQQLQQQQQQHQQTQQQQLHSPHKQEQQQQQAHQSQQLSQQHRDVKGAAAPPAQQPLQQAMQPQPPPTPPCITPRGRGHGSSRALHRSASAVAAIAPDVLGSRGVQQAALLASGQRHKASLGNHRPAPLLMAAAHCAGAAAAAHNIPAVQPHAVPSVAAAAAASALRPTSAAGVAILGGA